MWGEGASDLWGRLEAVEDDRGEAELEAVRARLRLAMQERDCELVEESAGPARVA
jgi:hypothetical protein